jgi:hypothetical protein
VREQGLRAIVALAVAALLVLLVAACGGSDEEPDQPEPAAATPEGSDADGAADGSGGSGEPGGSDDSGGDHGAGEDGDDADSGRIQDIGEPASDEDRKAMIVAVKSYFAALADGDPAAACEWLSTATIEELERMFEESGVEGGCETFLQHAANVFSSKGAPDYGAIEFSRFRVDGDRGLAVYKVPKRPRSFILTAREDDGWRVAGIDGTALP